MKCSKLSFAVSLFFAVLLSLSCLGFLTDDQGTGCGVWGFDDLRQRDPSLRPVYYLNTCCK
jgi:hypothetical protein